LESMRSPPRFSRLGSSFYDGDVAVVSCIVEMLTPRDLTTVIQALVLGPELETSSGNPATDLRGDGGEVQTNYPKLPSAIGEAVRLVTEQIPWIRAIAEAGQLRELGYLLDKIGVGRASVAQALRRTGACGEDALPFLEEHLYIRLVSELGTHDLFVRRLNKARWQLPGLHAQWSNMLDPKARTTFGEMKCICAAGRSIVSGTSQGVLQVNDLMSGMVVFSAQITPDREAIDKLFALSPWRIACAWKGTLALIRLGHLHDGEQRVQILISSSDGQDAMILSCMTRPSRQPWALLLATGWLDGQIRLWDAKLGIYKGSCSGHTGSITALCPLRSAAGGADLASASTDGTICLWKCAVPSGQPRLCGKLRGHVAPVQSLSVMRSPETNVELLLSGSRDFSVRVWDLQRIQLHTVCRGHRGSVVSVTSTQDGRILSSSWDRSWILFNLSGQILASYKHKRGVQFVKVLHDSLVISVSTDNVIHMTDISTGHCVAAWSNPNCICGMEVVRPEPTQPELIIFGCRAGRIGVYC